MTFEQIKTVVKDVCGLSSTEADTRIGKSVNRHHRRITASLGLDASRFVTRTTVTTNGVQTVTFTEIEKIDRVIDTTDSDAIRLLQEVSVHEIRSTQPSDGQPTRWALQNTDADSVTILMDTVPQSVYSLQADGQATLSDLSGSDEPVFPESYHDILAYYTIAEELIKKEKVALAREYATFDDRRPGRAERLLADLRFYLADSPTRVTKQASSTVTTGSGSGGGGGTVGGTSYTQTGLITFDRDPSAPFAVTSGSGLVTNLDADLLDGKDWNSNLHLTGAVGIGIANQSDVQLSVFRSAATSGHKTAQIDMNLGSGAGGTHVGLQVNCRTPIGSTYDGTGAFLFGQGIECATRRPGSATVMALNAQGRILSGGTGNSINAVEIDVSSEAQPTSRAGLTIAAVPSSELPTTENTAAGAGALDTAIVISAKRYGAKFNTGINFFQTTGAEASTGFRWPIQTTGTLIKASPGEAATIARGIDFSDADLTISDYAIIVPGFRVMGDGKVGIGGADASTLLHITRNSTNTTTMARIEEQSTGDPVLELKVAATSWYVGLDNSDSDTLKIGTTEGFGSNVLASLTTGGDLAVTGDITGGGELVIAGPGPHVIGGAVSAQRQLLVTGTFAERTGLCITSRVQPPANQPGQIALIAGTIDEAGSGTHALLTSLSVSPFALNSGAATVADTATIYVTGAPSATVTGQNYAFWSDAGLNRFDGDGTHVLELPADATDPTSGGGAATGRIPVRIGGATRYLAYY